MLLGEGVPVPMIIQLLGHTDNIITLKIYAHMPPDHVASRRVAEKLGMGRERSFYNQRNRGILTHLYVFDSEATESR